VKQNQDGAVEDARGVEVAVEKDPHPEFVWTAERVKKGVVDLEAVDEEFKSKVVDVGVEPGTKGRRLFGFKKLVDGLFRRGSKHLDSSPSSRCAFAVLPRPLPSSSSSSSSSPWAWQPSPSPWTPLTVSVRTDANPSHSPMTPVINGTGFMFKIKLWAQRKLGRRVSAGEERRCDLLA
jgi:hypothetical protein